MTGSHKQWRSADRRAFRALMPTLLALMMAGCQAARPAPVVQGVGLGPVGADNRNDGPPAPSPAPPQPRSLGAPHPAQITVLPGDTLYSIARTFDIPVRALIDANHMEPPYQVVAGRSLILPPLRTYVVRSGETLYSVSRMYGVDATTLAQENHLDPPYRIGTGMILVLPPTVSPESVTAPASSAASAAITVTPLPIESVPLSGPAQSGTATIPPPLPTASAPAAAPVGSPPPPAAIPQAPAPSPRIAEAEPAPTPAPPESAATPSRPPEQTAALPPPPPRSGRSFLWPVHGHVIGHYGPGASGSHNDGINIAAPAGTAVVAADAGVVAYAGNELRGYGNLILIKHADGWMTAYAHNQKLLVVRGERVRRGQAIARVGSTGAVSEPQLHFEIRKGVHALDPASYLAPQPENSVNG